MDPGFQFVQIWWIFPIIMIIFMLIMMSVMMLRRGMDTATKVDYIIVEEGTSYVFMPVILKKP